MGWKLNFTNHFVNRDSLMVRSECFVNFANTSELDSVFYSVSKVRHSNFIAALAKISVADLSEFLFFLKLCESYAAFLLVFYLERGLPFGAIFRKFNSYGTASLEILNGSSCFSPNYVTFNHHAL